MENIDITDPNFSLSNNSNFVTNYTNSSWIYIGAFIFILFAGLIFYKYYQNKTQTYTDNINNQIEHPNEVYNNKNDEV